MTAVEFFFDPGCPWTWVCSRWVAAVAPHRDLDVNWRTWSLSIKNAGRQLPDTLPEDVKTSILSEEQFSAGATQVIGRPGRTTGLRW